MKRVIVNAGICLIWTISVANLEAAGDPRLVTAVKNGDQAAARSLLQHKIDVNASLPDGSTALVWAAQRDDLETADLLIRAGANVNAANDYGATPLWVAATKANLAMAEKLWNAGGHVNAALLSGETILMAAVNTGNLDLVKALLTHGADVNARESRGAQTPLMWAVSERFPDIARVLVEHGADIHAKSKAGLTPFLFAVLQGDLQSTEILTSAGADVNAPAADGRSPLLMASASGHEALSLFLLGKGAKPDAADRLGLTVLHFAAMGGQLELVKALLGAGINPNCRAIGERKDSGPQSTVNYPPVSIIGATPIFLAAEAGNAEVVRVLAAAGADLELPTKEGTTPLIVAAGAGVYQDLANEVADDDWDRRHFETGKVLVDLGVNVNAAGESGWTALHSAAYTGLDALVRLLVEKRADTEIMDQFGQTALSIAEGIITVGLGDAGADRRPRNVRRGTADLLLKLGATPLADSGVQIAVRKAK